MGDSVTPQRQVTAMNRDRIHVLFVAEAATLAHVARPLELAAKLSSQEFEIELACAQRYRQFFPPTLPTVHEIHSISSEEFLARLAVGRPLYDFETLRDYVNEDLQLLERLRPDVVVGDFRLSLAVSARKVRIPYVALANAYWSPFARPRFEAPAHRMTRIVGRGIGSAIFRVVRPMAFAYHAMPMRRLRREFGMDAVGLDLRRVYTDADHVAYADIPEVVPTYGLPAHHSYIGPVLWSVPVHTPSWWNSLDNTVPLVYVTLGSSGDGGLLPAVIEALAGLPLAVAVAAAGGRLPASLPPNVHCADYLPGEIASRRAQLVVCNGGSPTTQQALAHGAPVLGVCSNMDQLLNMSFVAARGAGSRLSSDEASVARLRGEAERVLTEKSFRLAAARVADEMRSYDAPARLAAILRSMI
jgi:UDP:flavonoid glycosyltransferase YjiC (YdhE family)